MVKTQGKGANKLYFKRLNFLRARSKHRKQTQSDAVTNLGFNVNKLLNRTKIYKYINW